MPPRRSAAEDNWSCFDLRCHGSFMSKRELWHFFSSFVIAAKLRVRRRESVSTHTSGWSAHPAECDPNKEFCASKRRLFCQRTSLLLKCLGAVIHDTLCKTKKKIKPCLLLKMHCKDIIWILWHDIKWVLLPFLMERALVIFKGSPLDLIVAAGGKSHLIMQKK